MLRVVLSPILLFFSMFIFVSEVYAQKLDLTCWKRDSLPVGERFEKAARSLNDRQFAIKGRKVKIVERNLPKEQGDNLPFTAEFVENDLTEYIEREFRSDHSRIIKKVPGGVLIGLDAGEFGGRLLFVSVDGKERYTIGSFHIKKFFKINGRLYAIEGISHMSQSRGTILEIFKDAGRWKFTLTRDLKEEPMALQKFGADYLIVTHSGLYKLDQGLNLNLILKAPFQWGFLYPSSMHLEEKDLFIAMRQGVLKIADFENSQKLEWYNPLP